MANPTTNYGFVLPTSTDLVTDLPADFDVALQGVDTRLKALQPGTTLGDLAYSSATANTNTRLGIGSTGNVLTVAGGVPTWAAPSASAANYTLLNIGGTALSGSQETVISGISGKESIAIFIAGASSADASSQIWIRINGLSTTVYNTHGFYVTNPATYAKSYLGAGGGNSDNKIDLAYMSDNSSSAVRGYIMFEGCNSAGAKVFHSAGGATSPSSSQDSFAFSLGGYVTAAAITSITVRSSSGNFDAGTVYVYAA